MHIMAESVSHWGTALAAGLASIECAASTVVSVSNLVALLYLCEVWVFSPVLLVFGRRVGQFVV